MENQVLPLISVGFCMASDYADLEKISTALNLIPSKSRKKNEWPQVSIDAGIAYDMWEIDTELITSMNVDEECKKLIDILKGKENIVKFLCKEYNMRVHIEVVIHMHNVNTPQISLGRETIAFLAMINATIGFDIYSYDEETDYE